MQKLTDLKGFQRSCFKLLWGWLFFSRLYCFILKWQLSPLLPLECLPVHLDCHLVQPPGLSRAPRRLAALLRNGRGARRGPGSRARTRRWLWVDRRLSTVGLAPSRVGVLLTTRGCCTKWLYIWGAFPRWQAQYYSLHTVYSPGHKPPHIGSLPQLCSCLASGVGVRAGICFFKLGEEPNSYCPWVPGQLVLWFPEENFSLLSCGTIQPQGLEDLRKNVNGGGEARGDERAGMDLWREEVAGEEFTADPTQTYMLVGGRAGKQNCPGKGGKVRGTWGVGKHCLASFTLGVREEGIRTEFFFRDPAGCPVLYLRPLLLGGKGSQAEAQCMVGCLISWKGWLDGKGQKPQPERLLCTPQSDCTEPPLLAGGAEAPLPVYWEALFANIFCFQFQEELWENLWIKPNAKRWTLFPFPFLSLIVLIVLWWF